MGKIVIFGKENCGHCQRAKALLESKDIPYEGINLTNDERMRILSIYLSGKQTVPQIFFNQEHIGGASDLLSMDEQVLEEKVKQALAAPTDPNFPPLNISDEELASAELPIGKILDKHTPDLSQVREVAAIIPYYQTLFGFVPNMYKYMAIWPKYITAWLATFLSLYDKSFEPLGSFRAVVVFTTSSTAACTYCTAHATQASLDTGTESDKLRQIFEFYQRPDRGDDSVLPFNESERALIRLARGAALNQVSEEDVALLHQQNPAKADALVEAVGLTTACFGFFNRFNDLMGVELEGPASETAVSSLGDLWDVGKHETQDTKELTSADNASVTEAEASPEDVLKQEKAFIAEVRSQLQAAIGPDLQAYLHHNLGVIPHWILSLPEGACQMAVAHLYVYVMHQGEVSPELKHLMLYVLTQATAHQYLNSLEAFLAYQAAIKSGKSPELASARLSQSLDAVKIKSGAYQNFDEKECAALRLASIASTYPPFTPSPLVLSLQRYYTPREIVELTMCLAVGGLAQRWTAVTKPQQQEAKVAEFSVLR